MDEATTPPVARGWLWAMRVAALAGLILHAGPLLLPALGWSGHLSALLGLLPGVTVAAGYGAVLWLLRSGTQVDDVGKGHVVGRLVGALVLLLSTIWIIGRWREASLGAILYLCFPPALLLISGWGLAWGRPARLADWARGLLFAVPFALAVYLVMPPPGHGPNYTNRAVGELRTIVSAEGAYSSANGDLFGPLECLVSPGECLPDYPAEAPVFLSSDPRETTQARHLFVFHQGPLVSFTAEWGQAYSGFQSFAVTAEPLDPDRPSFCTDASGQILMRSDGQPPAVEAGVCVEGPGVGRLD